MLFMLKIEYTMPPHFSAAQAEDLRQRENEHASRLIEQKTIVRMWRIVGTQANFSLWRTDTLEDLHATLAALPMFPYLKIQVTPVIDHPLASASTATFQGPGS